MTKPSPPPRPPKPSHTSIKVIVHCFLSFVICNIDRINLSVAILPMSRKYNWSDSTVGLIQSFFFLGYMTTQIPAGKMADIHGGRPVLATGVFIWSLCTILTPLAASMSLPVLLLARVILGVAEGVAMPAMNSLVVAGVQPAARSRALAFIYSGMYAGSIVGLIVTPILISLHGWESVFYVCGVIGILWVGIFLVTTRDLATDDAYGELSEAEHFPLADTESLPEGNGDFSDVPSLKDMFSASFVWAIIIAHFCCTWGYFVLLIWLPTYLNSRFSQDVTKSSLLSAIPWMAMLIFANIGGMIADTLLKYISVTHVRKLMQTVGFLVPAFFLVLVSVSRDVVHAMSFVTLALGFASFSQSGVYANHQDVAPAFAGTLLGISNTFASVPGLVGVYVSGVVLEVTGRQWGAVFGMAIGFYVVGAMVFVGWARGERQW